MAIEFSCPHCHHVLRTADDKAGLSAKCPACSEIIWVPLAGESTAAVSPPSDEGGYHLAMEQSAVLPPGIGSAGGDDHPSDGPHEIPPPRPPAQVKCPNCSAANDATAQACRYCGSSLAGAEAIESRPPTVPRFDVGEIISTAWRLYTQEIGLLLGACVILILLPLALLVPVAIPVGIIAAIVQDGDAIAILVVVVAVIMVPLLILFGTALQLGNMKLYFNVARGEGPSISDLFWGFTAEGRSLVLPALVVGVVAFLLVLLGAVLCCAPGIFVSLCCWPALPLLIDRRLTGTDAVGQTIEFAKRDLGPVLGIGAIVLGIQMVPAMIPYIGVILQLFTIPLAQLLVVVAYLRLTGQPSQFERWSQPAVGRHDR